MLASLCKPAGNSSGWYIGVWGWYMEWHIEGFEEQSSSHYIIDYQGIMSILADWAHFGANKKN